MKKSNSTIQSADNFTKLTRISQTYTLVEIDENVRLLKEYYSKIRYCEELRKRHFFYLNTILNWTKADIANKYKISRERVGQILQSVKKGGGKHD